MVDVAHLANKTSGLGDRLVAIVGVEADGVVVDGVDYDEAGGDNIGGCDDPPRRVGEQNPAQPLPVEAVVEGEAGDQHRGDPVR